MILFLSTLNILLAIAAFILGGVFILFADSPETGAQMIHTGMIFFIIPAVTVISLLSRIFTKETEVRKKIIVITFVINLLVVGYQAIQFYKTS